MQKLIHITAAVFGFALMAFAGPAMAQEEAPSDYFILLPEEGDRVVGAGYFDLSASDAGGRLSFGYFGPLAQTDNDLFMFDLGVQAGLDDEYAVNGFSALAGVFYRYRLGEEQTLGVNAYLEGGRRNADDDFMGMASLGVEYELRPEEKAWFLQAGGNYYLAFNDYTDVTAYGYLGSAPRDGVDAFLSLGYDFEDLTLRGSLIGFNYFGTQMALPLTGYGLDMEMETGRGLPEGMTLGASLGLRDDSRANSRLSTQVGLNFKYTFGAGNANARVPQRDCALVRVANELPRVDCSQAVLLAGIKGTKTKEGVVMSDDLSPATAARGVRVERPRRNLGFGSMYTPIEYRDASITLVKVSGDLDDAFSFTSDILEFNTTITTSGGRGQTGSVRIEGGTYQITEVVGDQWTLNSVSCSGVESQTQTGNGIAFTIVPGANAVCTFNNGFTPTALEVTASGPDLQICAGDTVDLTARATGGAQGGTVSLAWQILSTQSGATLISTTGSPVTLQTGSNLADTVEVQVTATASLGGTGFTQTQVDTVTVQVLAADAAGCLAQITIVKSVEGADAPAQDYTFSGFVSEPDLTLSGDGGSQTIRGTQIPLAPGNYTISEVTASLPVGFELTSAACTTSDGTPVSSLSQNGVAVDLSIGDDVTCTFVNTYTKPPESCWLPIYITNNISTDVSIGIDAWADIFQLDGSKYGDRIGFRQFPEFLVLSGETEAFRLPCERDIDVDVYNLPSPIEGYTSARYLALRVFVRYANSDVRQGAQVVCSTTPESYSDSSYTTLGEVSDRPLTNVYPNFFPLSCVISLR